MSDPNAETACGRCGQGLFQSDADVAAGRWNTIYRNAVDPYQCPDFDAGIVINDGHYPARIGVES